MGLRSLHFGFWKGARHSYIRGRLGESYMGVKWPSFAQSSPLPTKDKIT